MKNMKTEVCTITKDIPANSFACINRDSRKINCRWCHPESKKLCRFVKRNIFDKLEDIVRIKGSGLGWNQFALWKESIYYYGDDV